ncbi:citrate lyase synthetase [Liquorilactobacillus ghanensis DSM 18630]|uniref:[Citrate [pro-3S]-lyase] ligase n=1 Tax=Liquorilactobacillus ghanensis DSM 18630 TaxID=1423750 RepID=A0A0R1VM78_9LACO|nr:[citrate (pro-3S)-lyase] ligase [Liquorilactobacillus ghanensis]KRM06437.1 citrate lyase synthetase [Liquorilactobacillus ghanensis DSM 18630]
MVRKAKELNLKNNEDFALWKNFLENVGINNFSEEEVNQVDLTIGIFDKQKLLATGSLAGNILKYIAVSADSIGTGSNFNLIVSELIGKLALKGIFHTFVFTKPKYVTSFQHLGFKKLAVTEFGAVLERGFPDISTYLADIKQTENPVKKTAAIVMNANPFTLGHKFLVEQASQENDLVYVFVVATNAGLFATDERLKLVKQGTQHLSNVKVVSGGSYMVSYATFPAYFLDSPNDLIEYQTTLDALVFKNWIANYLHINTRYLGSEPLSRTTSIYNKILKKVLTPEISVKIINRRQLLNGEVISASNVRKKIAQNKLNELNELVPETTLKFIRENAAILKLRIKKGMKIRGN